MAENHTAATLDELEQVRTKVRSDRRPASVSLAVLAGTMTLVTAAQWIEWWRDVPFFVWPWLDQLLMLSAPVGFALIALRYRTLERNRGVRTEWRGFLAVAIVVLISLVVTWPVWLLSPPGVPFGLIGLALLVIARRQRSGLVAAGALIFGIGGVLQTYYVLSNRLYDVYSEYVTWAPAAVWTLLAVALVALAVVARRREVRT